MFLTENELRKIVRLILEDKSKIKNPGPYIDGARATTVKGKDGEPIDKDGDGVPNKADPKPEDGSIKEAGCGNDLMPVYHDVQPAGLVGSHDVPDQHSYDLAMDFMENNHGVVETSIDALMAMVGATCKRSFLMAVSDYFSNLIDHNSVPSNNVMLNVGGLGF